VAILPQKPSARQGCWHEGNRQFFCSCWVLKNRNQKVKELEWEMWRTGRGGIDGLKNRSGKCEGLGGGLDGLKNRSGKCEGLGGGGVDGVNNRSGKCEGPGQGGDQRLFEKIKVFLKNQTHEPNIVEITHLCIMHEVHNSFSKVHSFFNNLGNQKKNILYWHFALKGCAGGQLQFSDLMRKTYFSCKIVELGYKCIYLLKERRLSIMCRWKCI
jgi:hypothetical protein